DWSRWWSCRIRPWNSRPGSRAPSSLPFRSVAVAVPERADLGKVLPVLQQAGFIVVQAAGVPGDHGGGGRVQMLGVVAGGKAPGDQVGQQGLRHGDIVQVPEVILQPG